MDLLLTLPTHTHSARRWRLRRRGMSHGSGHGNGTARGRGGGRVAYLCCAWQYSALSSWNSIEVGSSRQNCLMGRKRKRGEISFLFFGVGKSSEMIGVLGFPSGTSGWDIIEGWFSRESEFSTGFGWLWCETKEIPWKGANTLSLWNHSQEGISNYSYKMKTKENHDSVFINMNLQQYK